MSPRPPSLSCCKSHTKRYVRVTQFVTSCKRNSNPITKEMFMVQCRHNARGFTDPSHPCRILWLCSMTNPHHNTNPTPQLHLTLLLIYIYQPPCNSITNPNTYPLTNLTPFLQCCSIQRNINFPSFHVLTEGSQTVKQGAKPAETKETVTRGRKSAMLKRATRTFHFWQIEEVKSY